MTEVQSVAPLHDGRAVLRIRDLKKYFELKRGLIQSLRGNTIQVRAVDGISFDLHPGEILGLVGESGCGKTTTGRLIARLEDPTEGQIDFEGVDIASLQGGALFQFRKDLQMIFQDPYESLNPRYNVFRTVAEPIVIHRIGSSKEERAEMVIQALEDAGLRPGQDFM